MTTTTTPRSRREHLLSDVVAGILATASFGSSLRHVQTVAASHGQHGAISWTIAISVELVALVAILELRRARGQQRVPIAAVIALAAGLTMSAGANLATATGRGFGWSQVVAIWPAIAYVLVAVIIETRPASTSRDTSGDKADDASRSDVSDVSDNDTSGDTTPDAAGQAVDDTVEPDQGGSAAVARHDVSGVEGRHPGAAHLHSVPNAPANRAAIPADLLIAVLEGKLTQAEAAKRAGVSVRTLQRRLDSERERLAGNRTAADARRE